MKQTSPNAHTPSYPVQSPNQLRDSCMEMGNERDVSDKMRKYSNIRDAGCKIPSMVSSYKNTSTDDSGSLKHNHDYTEIDKLKKLEAAKAEELSKVRSRYKDIYSQLFRKKLELSQKREKLLSAQRVNCNLKQFILSKMME